MSDVEQLIEGIVTRTIGGLSWVVDEQGIAYACKLRGRFMQDRRGQGWERLLPGDRVRILPLANNEGVIEEILPRDVTLKRPQVANVTQVLVVVALTQPTPNLDLLDRLLVLCEYTVGKIVLALNKVDLVDAQVAEEIAAPYVAANYSVVFTSGVTGQGIDELRRKLAGHVTVLAGESGAGKSSILNCLVPELKRATQSVSQRTGRGRHTTRAVELFPISEKGWIADSPGFSTLDVHEIPKEALSDYYPEFAVRRTECRFGASCLHWREPDCRIKELVESGGLDKGRYERYLRILQDIIEYEARRY